MLVDVMAGRPPTRPAPPFGQKLAALRKERGLTQAQLAERMAVAREVVDYYERRAKNPSVETIQKVADALGAEPAYFLDGKKAEKRKPGPPSVVDEKLAEVKKLPRRKQEQLVRMIDAFLAAERRAS
jgi:transcriptional regulator with XRE-family HTH domain